MLKRSETRTGPLVYVVAYSILPSRAANSVQVARMCAALVRQGAHVVLFCRRGDSGAQAVRQHYGLREEFPIRALRLPRIPVVSRLAHSLVTALRVVFAPRPDLLYGRDPFALALLSILPVPIAPIVFETHRPPAGRVEEAAQRLLLRCRRLRKVVVISDALRRDYEHRFGERVAGRILLARDGADPSTAAPNTASTGNGTPLRLGYVGSLSPGKGMELITRLAARLPEHEFHVVGGSAPEVAAWRAKAGDNLVLHGFAQPDAAARRIAEFDAMLAPYQGRVLVGNKEVDVGRWMSPLKLFEYMAAAKPIIASDLGVLREFLRHEENALLAAPDDVEAWIAQIDRLAQDRSLGERLGARARDELQQSYTWDHRARAILQGGVAG